MTTNLKDDRWCFACGIHNPIGLKLKDIAKLQNVSISTAHGRYRYGMDKLRTLLNGEI